jgi:catechol 2,3-dioxygenase-like lactoylglutathione lyase family enzyme
MRTGRGFLPTGERRAADRPTVRGTLLVERAFRPRVHGEGTNQMKLRKTYTALFTSDLAAAERWYTKLLGRGPDNRPMKTLVQWELFDQSGLALSSDDEIASRGVMFLYVDDVAAERRRLQSLGIALGNDIRGDYSTLAQVRDPDGNVLTLATPPSRPFPPA